MTAPWLDPERGPGRETLRPRKDEQRRIAEAGRSADRRGKIWQRVTAAACRLNGFPGADHVGSYHAAGLGDITGVGDRIIECTVQPMSALAAKLRQAESDAIRSEFGEYYVVKKAVRESAARAYLITRLEVGLPLLARLDRLEAWEAEQTAGGEDAFERGFAAGVRAAMEGTRT